MKNVSALRTRSRCWRAGTRRQKKISQKRISPKPTPCTCGSLYTEEAGGVIHYPECAVIRQRLGY